jgi:NAD(P)H dehydrogenase (quinone)
MWRDSLLSNCLETVTSANADYLFLSLIAIWAAAGNAKCRRRDRLHPPLNSGGLNPVKITVILAHPALESFNHAIADATRETLQSLGHEVNFHDLYMEHFDPILPAAELRSDAALDAGLQPYCREIADSDGIVLIHPNWWGQPPAMLKGWIDRVLRPGIAYRFLEGDNGEGVPIGLLKAQTAVIFNTSNTPAERERAVFGDPLEKLWETCILEFCGVKKVIRRMFAVVITSTVEQRRKWLDESQGILAQNFPCVECEPTAMGEKYRE